MVQLDPTADETAGHEILLGLLVGPAASNLTAILKGGLVQLALITGRKARSPPCPPGAPAGRAGRSRQSRRIGCPTGPARPDRRGQAPSPGALGQLLAEETDGYLAVKFANANAQLDPTAEDQRQAREALSDW